MNDQQIELRAELLGSFLKFTQVFYKIRTGREFVISTPISRESHYVTIAKALTKVFEGKIKRLGIELPPRYGKAISVTTPILTKEGWTVAGDIKVGDDLLGSKGWTKVTGVYPQGILPAKEIIFSDNQSVVCNDAHLWNVCDRYTPKFKTLTTLEIEESLHEADGRKHWRIPLVNGEYGEIKPFINPYLLGCWLGDGHSYYAAITTMDEEIAEAFRNDGHELTLYSHNSSSKAKCYGITRNGFSTLLRKHNLIKNKHFPNEIYHWNKEDRLALLQGLMDTDGTCGKNGQVSFTNTNHEIIKGCAYLVNSLGGIYRIYTRRCGTQTLNIRLPDDIKPFRLERKQQYVPSGIKCSPRRFIEAILPAADQEMVCFTVDAEDKLFAVGDGLILTHNSEMVISFIAWTLAHYPDSNNIFTSYSSSLSKKQTQTIRQIISLPLYRQLFCVELSDETSAKDNFETNRGGSVYAAGAGGTITGRGMGIQNCNRFSGVGVIDDIHKPDEVTSDTIRESDIDWYLNTFHSRVNGPNIPIIYIGHRLHEDDLGSRLRSGFDGHEWEFVTLPALDNAGNALHPSMHTKEQLLVMQEKMPYVFASQYQQNPQPAGGGIYKPEWFVLLDDEPEILSTFITCDTAETAKTYNDATVFSFWGLYKIKVRNVETGLYGLHWLDCAELWIEPKDLESELMQFYADSMRHPVKPKIIAIEKKSTGTMLLSSVKKIQGIHFIEIERNAASGSKSTRFLEVQPYVASRQVSLPTYGKHTQMCIEHMRKITANDTHRRDDICDTHYDAIKLGLIDKTIYHSAEYEQQQTEIVKSLAKKFDHRQKLRREATSWPPR